MRAIGRSVAGIALVGGTLAVSGAPTVAATCPTLPDGRAIATAAALRDDNRFLDQLGVRPTGSAAHESFIDWIKGRLAAIPGVSVATQPFAINRWSDDGATLRLRVGSTWRDLPIASTVDYAQSTDPAGVVAPLALVDDSEPITAANARGRIVVRPAPTGSIPQALFFLPIVSYAIYDPHLTISPLARFYGDFINYNARVKDLHDAADAGAAGLVFVKNLPRAQIAGHYEPYEGVPWGVPAFWLGSDEGKALTDAIAGGAHPVAQLTLATHYDPVVTENVLATLPGRGPAATWVVSHTDGTNAVEDNGPIAMLAMADYLARLPRACRPKTIRFGFTTAHFYQRVADPDVRNGGAEQLAQQLDRGYDKGLVSSVVTLEHLGALDFHGGPRRNGPGQVLRPTGQRSIQEIAITASPALVAQTLAVVAKYRLDRTILLQGADAPGATTPQHCDFGGEATPFNKHILPTVGEIAAPETLYDPAFGLEGIDFGVMRAETVAFTDLVMRLGRMSQAAIAGLTTANRQLRRLGVPVCTTP